MSQFNVVLCVVKLDIDPKVACMILYDQLDEYARYSRARVVSQAAGSCWKVKDSNI